MATIKCVSPEAVAKEACWLAFQACGSPLGMGWLQNRPQATKDDVWSNAKHAGDYPGGDALFGCKPGELHADYVFGKMMKLSLWWTETEITFRDETPRVDYQSWCRVYPTYLSLVEAAIKSLEGK